MIQFQLKHHSVRSFFINFPITTFLIFTWLVLFIITSIRFGFGYNENIELFAGIVPSKIKEGQVWRLLSYGYFHNGWSHFLSNIAFLFFFSPPLENYFSRRFYLLFHFTAVLATGLAIYLFSHETAVGASGFEYALLGFYLYISLFRCHSIDSKLRTACLIILALGAVISLQVREISVIGHLSGLITGFSIAALYYIYQP